MQFTGQVTAVKAVSGTDKYGQQYHGVELTVVEPKQQEGVWNNKSTVYVKDGTEQTFPIGCTVYVECNVDIKISQNGRAFNTVNCRIVTPQTF